MCVSGKIKGAKKVSNIWLIPKESITHDLDEDSNEAVILTDERLISMYCCDDNKDIGSIVCS